MVFLEVKLQSQLNDPGGIGGATNLPKVARTIDVSGGTCEDNPIKEVEELGSEFQVLRLSEVNPLEQRKVFVVKGRDADARKSAWRIPDRKGGRLAECIDIEVQVFGRIKRAHVNGSTNVGRNPIRPVAAAKQG